MLVQRISLDLRSSRNWKDLCWWTFCQNFNGN